MGTDRIHRCISLPNLRSSVLFLTICCEKKKKKRIPDPDSRLYYILCWTLSRPITHHYYMAASHKDWELPNSRI